MIGILAPMEDEILPLKEVTQNLQTKTIGTYVFYEGNLEGQPVVLLLCGIGKVAAAAGTALLIHQYAPQAIINVGSAGGLLEKQNVGDLVVCSGAVHHDVDLKPFGYLPGQLPGCPQVFLPDPQLLNDSLKAFQHLSKSGAYGPDQRCYEGQIGTGDAFMSDPERIRRVKQAFPDLTCLEMEGAAVAQTAQALNTPWIILRSLSDIAGKESPITFQEFLPLAAKNAGLLVRQLIKSRSPHGTQ